MIGIEVSALEDPWRDFMLPCLQFTCRLRNPQRTSIHYDDHSLAPRPDVLINQIHAAVIAGIELPEFDDNRYFVVILYVLDILPAKAVWFYYEQGEFQKAVRKDLQITRIACIAFMRMCRAVAVEVVTGEREGRRLRYVDTRLLQTRSSPGAKTTRHAHLEHTLSRASPGFA
ncbi:hypothetical protein MTO96_025898 [Rhipicephalus appendiculatus]